MKFMNIMNRLSLDYLNHIYGTINDIIAMEYLRPLNTRYLPWTKSTIRPSAVVKILNDITINNRECIVECGGGNSTFFIARHLANTKGHLYTIEHDLNWLNILRKMIKKEKLESVVTLIHAPLEDNDNAIKGNKWYSVENIEEALGGEKIDLLIVDGPPAYQKEMEYSRYPAVPSLKKYLNNDYAIFLDDITRNGEKKIADMWATELGIDFVFYKNDGRVAIGHKVKGFTIV